MSRSGKIGLILLALALAVCVPPLCAAAEDDVEENTGLEAVIVGEDTKLLRDHQIRLERFMEGVPEDHRVQLLLGRFFSHKHDDYVPVVRAMIPIDAEGRPDGVAVYKDNIGWRTVRTVTYKHGVKDGPEKEYRYVQNEDGKTIEYVEKVTPWKDDKIHGVLKRFHASGKVMTEVTYEEGTPTGTSRSYDFAGRLQRVVQFKDGQRHGELVDYWPLTGKPRRIIPYEIGVAHGVVRQYYENGQLQKRVPLRDGEFHGIEKRYDEQGELVKTIYWIRDEEVTAEEFRKRFEEEPDEKGDEGGEQ